MVLGHEVNAIFKQKAMRVKTLAIINLIGFILVVVINGLANGLPINGLTTGELSDMYPNLFVPAGFTFSIWGLIYLLLLLFVIYQLRSGDQRPTTVLSAIGYWFAISCLANASWILAWHYIQVPLSLLIMLMILGSLIVIYTRLSTIELSSTERWLVHLPFSVYLGWITVATIANGTTLLVNNGWNGGSLGPVNWTIIMIVVAIVAGGFFLWRYRDWGYVLVIIWALFGIYSKQKGSGIAEAGPIVTTCLIGMGALAVSTVASLLVRKP